MPRLLVIEDDSAVCDAIALSLRAEGLEVVTASSGDEGLRMAREDPPDLILLDLMLPRIDGLSLCRAVRRASQVPILMLTARGTEMDRITGLETGADDYMVKPFSTGELVARVRALLRRAGQSAGGNPLLLQVGDLLLDLATRRTLLGERSIKLTQKEFDLLTELIRNPGVVLSRDLLLTRVWGYDFLGDSHTVDVHIRWLREKIEVDPSSPVRITTVRGVGYRFEK